MAEIPPVPAPVKAVGVLMARAAELRTADPTMAYFCQMHAVQQVLGTNLHLENGEVANFATALLDSIEQFRANAEESQPSGEGDEDASTEPSLHEIISDDIAGQIYVEKFALRVFAKADREVREKRVTRATPGVFMAAATFLDVLRIFQNPLDQDIQDKIKYSKYHAARILKSFKEGQDPNEYDVPQPEEEPEEADETEDVPQGEETDLVTEPAADEPADEPTAPLDEDSSFGSSFPAVPSSGSRDVTPVLPTAPPVIPSAPSNLPSRHNFPAAPSSSGTVFPSTPSSLPRVPSPAPVAKPAPVTPVAAPSPLSTPSSHRKSVTKAEVQSILDQTAVVSSAQKHAKFAISALNYDDTITAIKELRLALDLLEQHSQ